MKKLTIILLSILCLFIAGCTPSAKEEAERLNKDYIITSQNIWHDSFLPNFSQVNQNKTQEEKEVYFAEVAEHFKPQYLELDKKIQAEKVQKSNEHLLELQKRQIKNLIAALDDLIVLKKKINFDQAVWNNNNTNHLRAIFDTRLEYDNEYKQITTGKGAYELTLANYQKINNGDSYEKIAEIFKMPGKQTYSSVSNLGDRIDVYETYKWEEKDKFVQINFRNNQAFGASQFHLQ